MYDKTQSLVRRDTLLVLCLANATTLVVTATFPGYMHYQEQCKVNLAEAGEVIRSQ